MAKQPRFTRRDKDKARKKTKRVERKKGGPRAHLAVTP
jgi:hypothetical protein